MTTPIPERDAQTLPNTGSPALPRANPEPPAQSPEPLNPGAEVSAAESLADGGSQIFLPVTITPGAPSGATDNSTFYVSTEGSDGKGDGSPQKPWATISHALSKVPDGSLIYVAPGLYKGQVEIHRDFEEGVVLRSEIPYAARLRNNKPVLALFYGNGLTVEGFDISHIDEDADWYVIQIQDSRHNDSGGQRITLRNNIIHDSYNNDLIKVNNGAGNVLIEGNIFYNQGGPEIDEHIDVNSVTDVTIQDNLFFNDFEGSGRENKNITGHFIMIKDSNGNSDKIEGSKNIKVQRNIFFNWQGRPGNSFVGIGDSSSVPFFQASNVLIENNLFLGNSDIKIHAVLKIIGGKDVIFRNNTISGDLPANTYAVRLDTSNKDYRNNNIQFYNNIWCDQTGTMGADVSGEENDFSDTPASVTESFTLFNNLYWNGGSDIPYDPEEQINYTNDENLRVDDPILFDDFKDLPLPIFNSETSLFADQFATIREVFIFFAEKYGLPDIQSPVIDTADRTNAPGDDLLGLPRNHGVGPDIGAMERRTP
ncbi:MAG TPA: right-handed parallel beta-helix repeat-containing protein [Anaerolineales bacterium]|nr:right-handed parallel beta-helix repeat-containing protein [Anaerolineales bacterium]